MDNQQQLSSDFTAGWKKLLAELTPLAENLSEYMPTTAGLQSAEDFCNFQFSQASMAYWALFTPIRNTLISGLALTGCSPPAR